jgi:hypothetical protein
LSGWHLVLIGIKNAAMFLKIEVLWQPIKISSFMFNGIQANIDGNIVLATAFLNIFAAVMIW